MIDHDGTNIKIYEHWRNERQCIEKRKYLNIDAWVIANIHWIIEKAREFQKKSISVLLTIPKPLTVWITINCGEFFKRWGYQTT